MYLDQFTVTYSILKAIQIKTYLFVRISKIDVA